MRVQYDITTECNLACEICYMDLKGQRLPSDVILSDVQIHPSSAVVDLGGGEPFDHSELEQIIRGILEHGNKIQLATNATHIPNWFYGLPNKDRILVQASLLAVTKETYAKICGKDCLEQVINNLKKISIYYDVFINTPLYKGNLDEVEGLLRISQSSDIPIHFSLVIPEGKAKNVELLSQEDIASLRSLLHPYIALFDVSANFMDNITHCPILARYYPLICSSSSCAADSRYMSPNCEIKKCVFGGV